MKYLIIALLVGLLTSINAQTDLPTKHEADSIWTAAVDSMLQEGIDTSGMELARSILLSAIELGEQEQRRIATYPEYQDYLDMGYEVASDAVDNSMIILIQHHKDDLFWSITLFPEGRVTSSQITKIIELKRVDFELRRIMTVQMAAVLTDGTVHEPPLEHEWNYAMPGTMPDGFINTAEEIINRQ